jgi:hypothetical protein
LSLPNFHCVSHISQAASGGEDAFFANSDAGGVFAIADGVSGYAIFAAVNSFSPQKKCCSELQSMPFPPPTSECL